jgi:hypothetical protein
MIRRGPSLRASQTGAEDRPSLKTGWSAVGTWGRCPQHPPPQLGTYTPGGVMPASLQHLHTGCTGAGRFLTVVVLQRSCSKVTALYNTYVYYNATTLLPHAHTLAKFPCACV